MRTFISIFLCLNFFNIVGQTPPADKIILCNKNLCSYIIIGDTKIKKICLPKDLENIPSIYDKNIKNFTRHEVSIDSFISGFNQLNEKLSFKELSNYEKKQFIKTVLVEKSSVYKEIDFLMSLLNLKDGDCDKDQLKKAVEILPDYQAVSFLLDGFDYFISEVIKARKNKRIYHQSKDNYIKGLLENRNIVANHLDFLLKRDYINYSQLTSSKKIIKGTEIFHDNDVLMPFLNEDKLYTGGGRFEIYTDYLRLNFLHNIFSKKYGTLTYQGLFFGAEAYTPFIRYSNIDSLTRANEYQEDRPFASYEYFGIAHYRLHYTGKRRSKTQFRVGLIGGARSEKVQSILHRDQAIKSLKVEGWENQIANGGRYAFNFDYYRDWILFSPDDDCLPKLKWSRPKWMHLSGSIGLNIGNFLTATEIGLGISNIHFKEQDGNNNFKLRIGEKSRWHFKSNIKLRYVLHNSSLAGFGILKRPEPDATEDIPSDNYFLNKNEIKKWLVFFDVGIAYRTRNITFFYRHTLHTQEFYKPKAEPIYGWGTIGLSFNNQRLIKK